jgi:predicted phosphate transport protein (TIGR00153 family)
MLGWFQVLMPKEERFLELFIDHSRILVAGAEALRGLLQGGATVEHYCNEIVALEHDADEITREVLLAIRRNFITPFDRSSIKDLITSMDDAIDQMHQTAKTITLFEVQSFDPPMLEMGEIIVRAANLTLEAVPLLRSIGKEAGRIGTITEEITRIEGRADDLHDDGLKALFRAHADRDPMAYIVGAEIYRHLEKVADRFDDIGNEITGLVIEHV